MFPKGAVPDKPDKKETTVYIVGEKDVQVALARASRTEVKRAAICACAVVVTTLILVAGTLGAITLWLSFHHSPHDGQFVGLFNGDHGNGHGLKAPTSGVKYDDGGLWPFGGNGHTDVTESITDVPGASTGVGDILIDGNDRGSSQSEKTTVKPFEKQTTVKAPSIGDHSDSSEWESFSAPYSVFSEQPDQSGPPNDDAIPTVADPKSNTGAGSGSGSIPDQDSEDYEEIPYKSSGISYYSSSFPEASYDSVYDPGTYDTGDTNQDWDWNGESGSGSGDTETSGDNFMYGFEDTLYMEEGGALPMLKTPLEFTVVRYPVPVSQYRTLCTSNTCTIGYMKGQDRIEVIETDLRMNPLKLSVLRKSGGSKLFTMIRDEHQGYRAILLDASGLCLLTRLENTENLDLRQNSASPIVEKLRVTLPVELPEPLLSQIGGPIMDSCRNVPVFWAQQVGDGDDISFINRMRRSISPPSRGDANREMTIEGGIHFQCCWCADADDPCPCECGRF